MTSLSSMTMDFGNSHSRNNGGQATYNFSKFFLANDALDQLHDFIIYTADFNQYRRQMMKFDEGDWIRSWVS
jgi:hypothetical protein